MALLNHARLVWQGSVRPCGRSARRQAERERSRAALAVAIANDPSLLVADEPTVSLNSQDGSALLALLQAGSARGVAVVLATSSLEVADKCDRVVQLRAGQLRHHRWDA